MQTFLPYANLAQSAARLDNKRLGKQRVEAYQILFVLLNPSARGWRNHPAVKMWRGHERALATFGSLCCEEWLHRGFNDTMLPRFRVLLETLPRTGMPEWLGDDRVNRAYRAALLAKNPSHYSQFGWGIEPKVEYQWPHLLGFGQVG